MVLGFMPSTFPSLLFVLVCSVFSPEGQPYPDVCLDRSLLRPATMVGRVVGFVVLVGGVAWLWKRPDAGGKYSKLAAGTLLSLFGLLLSWNVATLRGESLFGILRSASRPGSERCM